MKEVEIYTDGACSGNPGPGGWGAVLRYNGHEKEISGGERHTTNNRMELMAAIAGVEALNRPCMIDLYSDSKYTTDAFNQGWVQNWVRTDWKRTKSGPVRNTDLWKRLLKAKEPHEVTFHWVRGHNGHPENERCDRLATTAADGENLLTDDKAI